MTAKRGPLTSHKLNRGVLTTRFSRDRLAARSKGTLRGGRGGNRRRANHPNRSRLSQGPLECNIPSHIIGEAAARDVRESPQSSLMENVRLDRMFQRDRRSLNRRRALALALGAATVAVAAKALPRTREVPRVRFKRSPRFPRVVGVPRSRTPTTAGSPAGGGRHFRARPGMRRK